MRSLILPELGFDCRFSSKSSCVRKAIGQIFAEANCLSDKISRLEDHAVCLRDEMKKIDAFKRELPMCMLLLSEAIVATEEEIDRFRKSDVEPKASGGDDEKSDKMNWMRSVQLWNSDNHTDVDINNDLSLKLDTNNETRRENETNRPGTDDDDDELAVPSLSLCTPEIKVEGRTSVGISPKSSSSRSGSSSATDVNTVFKGGNHLNSTRKQRRCWSPELHRQFINALHQLGGAQAATPKQIRELMQVDGLTNDEVKSHLQKYRLHTRRLSANLSAQSVDVWMCDKTCNKKRNESQSGSPEGPLQLNVSSQVNYGGNGDDEDDEKSEMHSWKDEIHLSGGDN